MKWGWTQKTTKGHTTKGHSLFSDEQKKIQSIETQTFVKILFLASPRIVSVTMSGASETHNSQCRAGARRSQEISRDRHTPVWALAVWWFGGSAKSKIPISWFGYYSRQHTHFFINHLIKPKKNNRFTFQ
jgi:hypothetical protein